MARYIDFAEVKSRYPILDVAHHLGIALKRESDPKKYRGNCPFPNCGEKRSFVVTIDGGRDELGISGCHRCKTSADSIGLVAKLKGFASQRDAAEWIEQSFGTGTVPEPRNRTVPNRTVPERGTVDTVPEEEGGQEGARTLQPLSHLVYDHEKVQDLGLDADTAERLGIGYAKKGIMAGHVAVPVRLPDGSLTGYVGVKEAKLPPRFQFPSAKVIPLKRA